jgi:hypothetical protein
MKINSGHDFLFDQTGELVLQTGTREMMGPIFNSRIKKKKAEDIFTETDDSLF